MASCASLSLRFVSLIFLSLGYCVLRWKTSLMDGLPYRDMDWGNMGLFFFLGGILIANSVGRSVCFWGPIWYGEGKGVTPGRFWVTGHGHGDGRGSFVGRGGGVDSGVSTVHTHTHTHTTFSFVHCLDDSVAYFSLHTSLYLASPFICT
ncbi:hypothetical protein GE21DRAFT_1121282 [Neurospora crassa]|nr:hypothetical protein GE21DRAFT_1121282 [Neurospora crassa]